MTWHVDLDPVGFDLREMDEGLLRACLSEIQTWRDDGPPVGDLGEIGSQVMHRHQLTTGEVVIYSVVEVPTRVITIWHVHAPFDQRPDPPA